MTVGDLRLSPDLLSFQSQSLVVIPPATNGAISTFLAFFATSTFLAFAISTFLAFAFSTFFAAVISTEGRDLKPLRRQ